MKSRQILCAFIFLILGLGDALASDPLEVGAFSIGGKLQLDVYSHRLGDNWRAVKAGPGGINYNYFPSTTPLPSPDWQTVYGQTLFLDIGLHPTANLTGDLGFEFIREYADRYWQPVNLEHRLYINNKIFSWNRADITYTRGWAALRYFRGVGHYNWQYEGDLFNLFPEQNDPAKYLRVSGRAIPEGWQLTMKGKGGKLQLIYGPEVIWDYTNGFYANYNFTLGRQNFNLIYRDHVIPYGEEDERMRTAEASTDFLIDGNPLQLGVMYQPFRLNREYTYVEEVAPGAGKLGSRFIEKTGTTSNADALGASGKIIFKHAPVFNEVGVKYSYRGLVAGNKQQLDTDFTRKFSRSVTGALLYTYRKPLIGPIPLVYSGTPGNAGPAIFEPRGPSSPFWVQWENPDWDNREASIFSAVVTFDPTPDTWFYQYEANRPESWNINPDENARFSFAAQYRLEKYYSGTDRLTYWNENGHTVWEGYGVTGAWPTKDYIGAFTLLGKLNLQRWVFLADIGFGEALAINSAAYTTSTLREKPITNFYVMGLSARTGPYTAGIRYNHDYWGPEDWHRMFGATFDDLFQFSLTREFGEYFKAGLQWTAAREYDYEFVPLELGDYDEVRAFVTISFGPFIPYFGRSAPVVAQDQVGEAPEIDITEPQAKLTVSTTTFTPDGAPENVLTLRPWASDYSGVARWKITIVSDSGKTVKTFTGDGEPPFRLTWDGKDDIYGTVVPSGEYTLQLSADDEAGNTGISDPVKVTVQAQSVVIKEVVKEVIREVPKEISVKETKRGLLVSMTSRVLFDSGKSDLKPGADRTIAEVVKILKAYEENQISVEGHSDNVGSASYNLKLSERRAKSVVDMLVKDGISPERITMKGFGKDRPVAPNTTASGREANRRVEVIILK